MPRRRRRLVYQATKRTGTTNIKRDKARKALKPGLRISMSGRYYYEGRKNRSDLRNNI